MATVKKNEGSSIWSELLAANLYKRNQGRLTRQLTAVGLLLFVYFGAWALSHGALADIHYYKSIEIDGVEKQIENQALNTFIHLGIPVILASAGTWVVYRIVNYPRFADFLISVEAEMDKVSWSSWPELWRSTAVVIVTMVLLAIVLLSFDVFWHWFFELIKFNRIGN